MADHAGSESASSTSRWWSPPRAWCLTLVIVTDPSCGSTSPEGWESSDDSDDESLMKKHAVAEKRHSGDISSLQGNEYHRDHAQRISQLPPRYPGAPQLRLDHLPRTVTSRAATTRSRSRLSSPRCWGGTTETTARASPSCPPRYPGAPQLRIERLPYFEGDDDDDDDDGGTDGDESSVGLGHLRRRSVWPRRRPLVAAAAVTAAAGAGRARGRVRARAR